MKLMEHKGGEESWKENLDFNTFVRRYAPSRKEAHGFDGESSEWTRHIETPQRDGVALCCPEDVRRGKHCKHELHKLCPDCSIPVCFSCWIHLWSHKNFRIPAALANDNFQGYCHPFLIQHKVRWIEAVTACPIFTGLVTYYIEGKSEERHHLAGEELGQTERSYAVRGNVFSFMMPWMSIMRHVEEVTNNGDEIFEHWPQPPAAVAHMIRVAFVNDTDHVMHHLKELRLRAHVLRGLGRVYMDRLQEDPLLQQTAQTLGDRNRALARYDAGVASHYPDESFGGLDGGMSKEIATAVEEQANEHAKRRRCTGKQSGFQDKNASMPDATRTYAYVQKTGFQDKNASMPDATHTEAYATLFDDVRPTCVTLESSASSAVEPSLQLEASLANFSKLNITLGTYMNDSYSGKYLSRVMPWTFNYMSGGPEFPQFFGETRKAPWRRVLDPPNEESAVLDPPTFTKNLARRAEMQFGSDWMAVPAARNLSVRYSALRGAYLNVRRHQRQEKPAPKARRF